MDKRLSRIEVWMAAQISCQTLLAFLIATNKVNF